LISDGTSLSESALKTSGEAGKSFPKKAKRLVPIDGSDEKIQGGRGGALPCVPGEKRRISAEDKIRKAGQGRGLGLHGEKRRNRAQRFQTPINFGYQNGFVDMEETFPGGLETEEGK